MQLRKLVLLMQAPFLFSISGGLSFAADRNLEEITITATRDTNSKNSSRNISVISQEEIEKQQATSVPQLVNYLPNVTLTGGPRNQVQDVNIRGLGGNRVLQLIDGVRQNFVSGHRPTYFLDPSLLKNVEVLKGPSSSLWGSGALGGVVSQNTIHAADLLHDNNLGGFVKQGYQSNGDNWTTTAALASRVGNVDLLLSGYYRDGNDLELGNGDELENSADRDKGVLAKLDWFIDNDQVAIFDFRRSYNNGGIPSNGAADVSTSNFLIDRETQTDQASFDYHFNPDTSLVNTKLTLYWDRTKMDESRTSDGRFDKTEIRTLGMNINNRSKFGSIDLIYGLDGYQDKLNAERGGSNRPLPPTATTDVWGAFSEIHIPIAEKWHMELGARYDYFKTEADNLDEEHSDNAFSPSAALIWKAGPGLSFTLRYDEAFRAPTSEEMYTSGAHFCMGPGFCNTFLPNSDLKPEESQNWELMTEYVMSDVLSSSDALTFNANIFHNDVDNFIEQRVDDPIFSPIPNPGNTYYRNIDKAELQGFEVAMNYRFDTFNAVLSYGQTRGQDKKTGEAISTIPADKWVLDMSNSWLQNSVKAGVTLSRIESQKHRPNDVNTEYEHYTLVDLYTRWTPRDFKNFTVDLTVNNLTDQYYRVAFQQLYMPGKDIRLGVRYDF